MKNKRKKVNPNYVYVIVGITILMFYLLFWKTNKTIFLYLFLGEWLAFNIYGGYLILKYALNKDKSN